MRERRTASGNYWARILILTAITAALAGATAYLRSFLPETYITAGLIVVLCLFFIAALAAAQSDALFKLCITVLLTIGLVLAFVSGAHASGIAEHFQSHDSMAAWIKSLHGAAEFVYVGFHIVQVLFLPIPGVVSIVAGTLLFGPFKAATLSLIGVMIGCMLMFAAGRVFGRKLAEWIAGKDTIDKYLNLVKGKDKIMFTAMFILPFFPDDLLCMVAGLTSMSFNFFFIMVFLTRIVALYTTAYFGSGEIIPYHGWGLAVWAALILGVSVLLVVLWRKGDDIQNFISKKLRKK